MKTAQPIRNPKELEKFKNYYLKEEYNLRNYLLIVLGLNTALRISDVLQLQWRDVYNFERRSFYKHIYITEQKTHKKSQIFINKSCLQALKIYKHFLDSDKRAKEGAYLFEGKNQAQLSRYQAWRIVKRAAENCNIQGVTSPHSLRKTFGYMAWKNGITPAMLMNIYNHSSFEITKRYLGIVQDDRDKVFQNTCI